VKKKVPPVEPSINDYRGAMQRALTFRGSLVFTKSVTDLPEDELHLVRALQWFFAYRHNGFLLVEALEICTRHDVNPPSWVLVGFNDGFEKYKKGRVTLEQALGMTKRHKEEFDQYYQEQPIMEKLKKIIDSDPNRRIGPACFKLGVPENLNIDTLEKKFRRFWGGFYDYVDGRKFPKKIRKHLPQLCPVIGALYAGQL